ncbi:MAG: type I-B CRISPR-associated protein Cas5b [Bacteroidetes bacterium]|nr:type I-B CRISPR-associated protein Cas5b [Bacteroidota bacterium]
MEILIVDLYAGWGHFKKPYTTTSPLSFSLPPKTTLYGWLGAVLGLEKEKNEYLKVLNQSKVKIGIQLLKPVKKMQLSELWIDTENNKTSYYNIKRTRIRMEWVKDVKYRLFLQFGDPALAQKAELFFANHWSFYTSSLGLSEALANYHFVGKFPATALPSGEYAFVSVLPVFSNGTEPPKITLEPGKEYFNQTHANTFTDDRVISEMITLIYERSGEPILSTRKDGWQVKIAGTQEPVNFVLF